MVFLTNNNILRINTEYTVKIQYNACGNSFECNVEMQLKVM